ncbi:MAG: spike base protein, RCAP_Rcc01079 family [Candidatus Fonsibacter sp.]
MANLKLQTSRAAAVTKSDTVDIPYPGDATAAPNAAKWPCVLYVGTGGTLRILTAEGDDVTLLNVPSGTFIPIQVIRVFSSTTLAADIIALW